MTRAQIWAIGVVPLSERGLGRKKAHTRKILGRALSRDALYGAGRGQVPRFLAGLKNDDRNDNAEVVDKLMGVFYKMRNAVEVVEESRKWRSPAMA
jgi:hypothetical protein